MPNQRDEACYPSRKRKATYDMLEPGGRAAKARRRLAEKAVEAVSGGGGATDLLLRDAVGFANATTDLLVEAFKDIGDSKCEAARARRLMTLYPLRGLSLATVQGLGFPVSKKLWASLQTFKPWDMESPADLRSKKAGRPNAADKKKIEDAWVAHAAPTSGGVLTVHGQKRDMAERVKAESGTALSWWSVLRLRPAEVVFARKKTDLCPICEEYRLRQKAGEDDFASAGGEPAWLATADMGGLSNGEAINLLKLHLDYRDRRRREFLADCANPAADEVVVVVDWAGKVEVISERGTGPEFHKPTRAVLFGAAAYWRPAGDEPGQGYFHAYGHPNLTLQKTGAASATATYETVTSILAHTGPTVRTVTIWADTAQHFRNGVFFHEVPRALLATGLVSKVRIRMHAPYHGKSFLDPSFAKGKMWVREHVNRATLTDDDADFAAAVRQAYSHNRGKHQYFPLELSATGAITASQLQSGRLRKLSDITAREDGSYELNFACGERKTLSADVAAGKAEERPLGTAGPASLALRAEKKTHALGVQKMFS